MTRSGATAPPEDYPDDLVKAARLAYLEDARDAYRRLALDGPLPGDTLDRVKFSRNSLTEGEARPTRPSRRGLGQAREWFEDGRPAVAGRGFYLPKSDDPERDATAFLAKHYVKDPNERYPLVGETAGDSLDSEARWRGPSLDAIPVDGREPTLLPPVAESDSNPLEAWISVARDPTDPYWYSAAHLLDVASRESERDRAARLGVTRERVRKGTRDLGDWYNVTAGLAGRKVPGWAPTRRSRAQSELESPQRQPPGA
jgi:hypothetical protein